MVLPFLLFLIPLLPLQESAEVVVLTGNHVSVENFNDQLLILEDPSHALTINEVLLADGFEPYDGDELQSSSAYWGKLQIKNHSSSHPEWMLYIGKNDFIEVYIDPNSSDPKHLIAGYQVPASQRSVQHGSYIVPLSIPKGQTVTAFIRIREDIHSDPEFDLRISEAKGWMTSILNKIWIDLLFQGIFWIMAVFNFLVFFNSGERANLYYALYLTFVAIFYLFITGILRQYIIGEFPAMTPYFMSSIALSVLFYCAFLRSFLDTSIHIPIWDRLVKGFIAFDLVMAGVVLIINGTGEILLASRVIQFVVFVNSLLALTMIPVLFRAKIPLAKYFIAGTGIFVISVFLDAGFWDPGSSEAIVARFGLIGEILFFSLGLGQRIKVVEKEKQAAQAELIKQLEINQELTEQRKDELEESIRQRTGELEEKNKELTKAKDEAERAAMVKSDFLSVMSHEIRTPMNAVIGMTHILLEDNPKAEQLENLNTLRFSAESLLVLINDILDYSKIESGKVQLEHVDFDLTEVVRGLGYMFRPKAQSQSIQFSILLDQETPTALNGDPIRLTQILNNLISNAIKFTPKGQVTLYIHLVKKTSDSVTLKFVIEDTGIGIEKEKLKMIFDTFSQANFDTTRKYGGTGLGLAITKKLLDLFDSGITVQSQPEKGSKFSFELALKPGKSIPKKSAEETITKKGAMKGLNILVVDDNLVNRIMVERFLEKWKVKCKGAASGKGALEMILEEDFDLILLDLQMPEMDGYEVARTIRGMKSERFINLPIVAISADTLTNVYHKVLSAGMDDFISKPFNPNELFNLVYNYSQLIKKR